MDLENYDKEVQEWLNCVLDARIKDLDRSFLYCNKLIEYGNKHSDSAILGFAHYYISENYYLQNNIKDFSNHLLKSVEHQQISKNWELLARSYNLLGITTFIQGNYPLSFDYYLTGLEICERNHLTHIAGLINNNIGSLFFYIKDYKNAIKHMSISKEYFDLDKDNPYYIKNICVIYTFLADCFYHQDKLDCSLQYLQLIDKYNKNMNDMYDLNIYTLAVKTKIYYVVGEYQKSEQCLDEVINLTKNQPALLDLQEDYFFLLYFLLDIKKYDKFLELLKLFEIIINKADFDNSKLELSKLKIAYYKKVHDEDHMLKESLVFYEASKALDEKRNYTSRIAIDFRVSLEDAKKYQKEIEMENAILQIKSQQDPLTKLANRSHLNDFSEEAFDRAFMNQTSLAVGIFDVDYFKQYNDTYGHQAGDEVLVQIANILREYIPQNIFFARYGGDEFIFIMEGKTDKEVLAFAHELKNRVIALNIEHSSSLTAPYVTISQGIRNSIPLKENKMWDFLHAADTALYLMKRNCRNDICLVHKLPPQENIPLIN